MSNGLSITEDKKTFTGSETTSEKTSEPSLIDWKTIWKPLSIITGIFLIFSGCRWKAAGSPAR